MQALLLENCKISRVQGIICPIALARSHRVIKTMLHTSDTPAFNDLTCALGAAYKVSVQLMFSLRNIIGR